MNILKTFYEANALEDHIKSYKLVLTTDKANTSNLLLENK